MSEEKLTRIAIVNGDKCKPTKCAHECKRSCPVVRMGKMCIEVKKSSDNAKLSEELCNGCGICVKKCPFKAIKIINLPKGLERETTHRYGPNSFKLHRLPQPKPGRVLGLIGRNGIGKSTALKVLAGKLKPNLGNHSSPADWQDILTHFRGNELQNYFTKMLENKLSIEFKPQGVNRIPKFVSGTVGDLLEKWDQRGVKEKVMKELFLEHLQDREIKLLSGGELQRFSIAAVCMKAGNVYIFDEPSSFLDIKQRLKAADVIRELPNISPETYVIAVEHDLAVLDYLSDFVCCLYGTPGAYGVVTKPFSVREGINIFLSGFVPTENVRFRDESLSFNARRVEDRKEIKSNKKFERQYPHMIKTLRSTTSKFKLNIQAGGFKPSEIVVMLGENGTGKSTFIRMLAGRLKPVSGSANSSIPELKVSYKPQKPEMDFKGTVRDLLHKRLGAKYTNSQFQSDVVKPMNMEGIMNNKVKELSGGEQQRVRLTLCLGKAADVYLIDEPSAYLDAEQRQAACRAIKRYILHNKKTAFVVEHDISMATYLADRVVVFHGQPGVECHAESPKSVLEGMNQFLEQLQVTFRKDGENGRPRINKLNALKDSQQKAQGTYFFLEE